jgi:hypothetical protein
VEAMTHLAAEVASWSASQRWVNSKDSNGTTTVTANQIATVMGPGIAHRTVRTALT